MRTFVCVDGFNRCYRMLKARPGLKWLNPARLASEVLHRTHEIACVNYYTARISQRANDPDAPARQATYLRALSTVPVIRIHEGAFLTSEPWMKLATPLQAKPTEYPWSLPPPDVVRVVKSEEKGSDVNLGVHLVRDALIGAFDVAVVLTNDSDLVEPIRIATQEAGKRVGLMAPVKFPNQSLMNAASFHLHIRNGHLRRAQFETLIGLPDGGRVERPATWVDPSH